MRQQKEEKENEQLTVEGPGQVVITMAEGPEQGAATDDNPAFSAVTSGKELLATGVLPFPATPPNTGRRLCQPDNPQRHQKLEAALAYIQA